MSHFVSPFVSLNHQFVGGPGSPGLLIMRRSVAASKVASNKPPHRPGGGTVTFTSNAFHSYELKLEVREEGGTPEIIGAIRAGAAFKVCTYVSRTI
jgi:selenocysteine lyase/cysteine desulfurase